MRFLRTNTAVIITVGPFYDKTDGVTIETALTITNERITLTADTDDGSAPTNILDNVTGATSGTDNDLNYITGNDAGMMQLELSAANTNRLGRMMLSITDAANHVPVFHEFMVVPALVYDTYFASTGGATFPAATLASTTNITAGTITTTTNLTNLPAITSNWLTAAGIAAGALNGKGDWNIGKTGYALSSAGVQAIWDALVSALTTVGSVGKLIVDYLDAAISSRASQTSVDTIDDFLDTEVAAIKTKTDSLTFTVANQLDANVLAINGGLTSGNNATLSLAQLNIVNSGGSAIVASSTGGNGHGVEASGNGSGEGISATGGATGHGIGAVGGATSGHGINAAAAASNSDGMRLAGVGAGSGLQALGGTTGNGIAATGGNTSGHGMLAQASGVGSSTGHGIRAAGNTSGEGISAIGGATGNGIEAIGGATSGNAINATATAGNGHGFNVAGQGSGHGINVTGGATGNGIDANGGATSGDGINAAATTSGDGMELVGAGGGLDLNATTTDSLEVNATAGGGGLDAAGVRAAVGLASANLDTQLSGVQSDTNDIQTRLPAALVSGRMSSDVIAISGSTTAADQAEEVFESLVTGAAQTGTLSTTQMSTNLTEATNDHYNGRLLTWVTGNLTGQQTDITDYDGATKVLTFTAVTEAPGNGDTFIIT